MKKENVLISGGLGFLGTNIAKKFLSEGHDVTILDNLRRKGVETNILEHPHYKLIRGDVRIKSDLDQTENENNYTQKKACDIGLWF